MLQIVLKKFCPVYACAQEIASLTRKKQNVHAVSRKSNASDPGLNVRIEGRIVLHASAAGGCAPFVLWRTHGGSRL